MDFRQLAKVQRTLANWRKSQDILAKVQWTLANWRKSRGYIGESTVDSAIGESTGYIGESTVDFRQLAKVHGMYWRKYSGLSPIGESPVIGESLIGEIREPLHNNILS